MLAMDGGGENCRGKTGQRSDLQDTVRSEDTNQGREKKIIARADSSRIPNIFPIDHRVKKIELAGRRNFARISQLRSELAILGLKLLERPEFTDVEAPAGRRPRIICESASYHSSDGEAAPAGGIPQDIEITGEGKFQDLSGWPGLRTPRSS